MRRSSDHVTERVSKHRKALRAAGLRPVQIWVPDTRKASFAAKCRRQSQSLLRDPHEKEVLTILAQMADTAGWR